MSLARYKILILMAKWFENESVRKVKWRPGGVELDYGYGMYRKWTSAYVD